MGTRSNGLSSSKVNGPLTVRGPVNGHEIHEAITALSDPEQYNNFTRRRARALIRKQAKHIRKHVPGDKRNSVRRLILRVNEQLRRY